MLCRSSIMGIRCRQHTTSAAVLLGMVALATAALPEDALFVPGTLPLDTDGKEVMQSLCH